MLLLAAQIFGLPFWLYLAAVLLYIALFPGMQVWDVGERWMGLSAMPSWYYAFAFPCGVVALNLVAYVGCGAAVHWFGKLMAMWIDRRSDPIPEPLGLGRRR